MNREYISLAKAVNAPISPRKVSLIAKAIRDKRLEDALGYLNNLNHKGAFIVKKLLNSAQANALQNDDKINVNNLYIAEISVLKGMTLKRMRPRAMGRGFQIRKKYSHITITLNHN